MLLPIFLMNIISPIIATLYVTAAPVLAWGEGGCSLFKKNKASQDDAIEQVDSSDSIDRKFQENE